MLKGKCFGIRGLTCRKFGACEENENIPNLIKDLAKQLFGMIRVFSMVKNIKTIFNQIKA